MGRSRFWRSSLTLALLVAAGSVCLGAAPRPSLKDEMRLPWTRGAGPVRVWLVCGDFPNPVEEGAFPGANAPRTGLVTDYLKEHGGEAAIRPVAGLAHKRPDGTVATWTSYTSPQDSIDFLTVFPDRPVTDVVAYAFTTITQREAGAALLAVGSDDGVRIWVNGKLVHDHPVRRGLRLDEDIVAASLKAGENAVLVKVEQGVGGWGLAMRVIEEGEARLLALSAFSPALEPDAGQLIVRTDGALARLDAARAPVRVDVIAPGGVAVASQTAPRGDTVRFDPARWADGPYEVVCQMTTPAGRPLFTYLPWYKGDARAAARRLLDSAPQADQTTPAGMVHAMLADMARDRLGPDLSKATPESLQAIRGTLMEYAELLNEQGGGPGGARPHGMVRLAYRDEVDDSPQFCRAYLPADYTPDRPWPMIVNLHGYNADNPPYVRWWSVEERHDLHADRQNVIVIYPMGRYNTSYRGIGDADVVKCIALAKQRFSVDEDRVYLTGYSMGGGGVWHVGTRHPDLFAALGPYYGGWDYHVEMDEDALQRLTPRERSVMERQGSFSQAEQLLNLPVWVLHGDADPLVNPDQSRYAVRMLQRWGYDVRYREVPGGIHGDIGGEDELYAWFLAHRRDAHPRHVRVRSADLSAASAYWVAVTQCEKPLEFINADVEVVGPNLIRLDTANVLEVTLTPNAALINPAAPATVIWNGEVDQVQPASDGVIVLRARGYTPGAPVKRPALSGGIANVTTTPYAIVLGTTSEDPMMRRLCELQADSMVRFWQGSQHSSPRFFRDTEIGDQDMAKYSLVLIGGPDENLVTKRLAEKLPLKITASEIAIGGRRFAAKDAVVRMVYPHPLNRERYVLVIAANSPAAMMLPGGPDDVDFLILDGRVPNDREGRPMSKVWVAAGSFDHSWRLNPEFVAVGDPQVRAQCPLRKAPTLMSAAVAGDALFLGDLLPARAEGTFSEMMRDTNWRGGAITLGGKTYPRGIAVNTSDGPNGVEFDIAGAGWKRLRAVIGIETQPEAETIPLTRENTRTIFTVRGDGKELYRSEPFIWGSGPKELSVDVTGVKLLRLDVLLGAQPWDAVMSADWADLRLER